jgi:hypothetical protein
MDENYIRVLHIAMAEKTLCLGKKILSELPLRMVVIIG